uniref:Protein phosphatase 1 regulatory subunit 21 n=1 Tax=Panagrellus redivivus TaxID=6233 RepID=A0A7E4UM11_PANRE
MVSEVNSNNVDDKYQKLSVEFAKLRGQIPHLQDTINQEQEKNQSYKDTADALTEELRKCRAENESLNFRNSQLLCRIETLQSSLDSTTAAFAEAKAKKKHKEANLRIFGAAQLSPSTSAGIPRADADRLVLEQELERKLAENAELHSRLFDLEKQHETVVMEFTGIVQNLESDNESLRKQMFELRAGGDARFDEDGLDEAPSGDRREAVRSLLKEAQKAADSFGEFFEAIDSRSAIYPCDATLESVPEEIHLFGLECGKLAKEFREAANGLSTMELNSNDGISAIRGEIKEVQTRLGTVLRDAMRELLPLFTACQRKECDAPWCNAHLDQLNGQYEKLFQQAFQKLVDALLPYSSTDFNPLPMLVELKKAFHRLRDAFSKKTFIENHLPTASKKLKNLNDTIEKRLLTIGQVFGHFHAVLDEDPGLASHLAEVVWDRKPAPEILAQTNGKKMTVLQKQKSIIEDNNNKLTTLRDQLNAARTEGESYLQRLNEVGRDVESKASKIEDLEAKIAVYEKQLEVLSGSTASMNELRAAVPKENLLDDFRVVEYYFLEELRKSVTELEKAKGKMGRYRRDIDELTMVMQNLNIEFDDHKQRSAEKETEIMELREELETTRQSYEEQLRAMSEHLAALNAKIVQQSDQLSNKPSATASSSSSSLKENLRKMVRK